MTPTQSLPGNKLNEIDSDHSTRQRILTNALDHFSKYGYGGASVREITQASQVTKPTLYYYFKNKEELFVSLAGSCFEEILTHLRAAAQKTGTTLERILNILNAHIELCQNRYPVVRFVHLISVTTEKNTPDVGVLKFGYELSDLYKKIIEEAAVKGEIDPELTIPVFYTIMGICHLRITSLVVKAPKITDFSIVESALKNALNCAKRN